MPQLDAREVSAFLTLVCVAASLLLDDSEDDFWRLLQVMREHHFAANAIWLLSSLLVRKPPVHRPKIEGYWEEVITVNLTLRLLELRSNQKVENLQQAKREDEI